MKLPYLLMILFLSSVSVLSPVLFSFKRAFKCLKTSALAIASPLFIAKICNICLVAISKALAILASSSSLYSFSLAYIDVGDEMCW